MKLLDKVGDVLLTRLVPGMDANASCGQCRYSHTECRCCGSHNWRHDQRIFMDLCGKVCYKQCMYDEIYACAYGCIV